MPGLRLQPPAGCSSRCGSTDGRSASPTAGLSGKRKEIKSSHTLSSVRMASQFYGHDWSDSVRTWGPCRRILDRDGAADRGLVDIHDRRPLVLAPEAAREWMRQDVTGAEAAEIASIVAVPADDFTWHPVTRAVGNVKNQGPELLAPLSP